MKKGSLNISSNLANCSMCQDPFFHHEGAFYKYVLLFHEILLLLSDMLCIKVYKYATFLLTLHIEGLKINLFWFPHRNTHLMSHSWPQFWQKSAPSRIQSVNIPTYDQLSLISIQIHDGICIKDQLCCFQTSSLHCCFDDDICTTVQAPLVAEGWPSVLPLNW